MQKEENMILKWLQKSSLQFCYTICWEKLKVCDLYIACSHRSRELLYFIELLEISNNFENTKKK